MKLENQVVSLELAKKLKDLGFKQKSLFYWAELKGDSKVVYDNTGMSPYTYWTSAYTVAELGEMLPMYFERGHIKEKDEAGCWWLEITKFTNAEGASWMVCYECAELDDAEPFADHNLANAKAKTLIYLKENNLL